MVDSVLCDVQVSRECGRLDTWLPWILDRCDPRIGRMQIVCGSRLS
jgi:hypothetical protein